MESGIVFLCVVMTILSLNVCVLAKDLDPMITSCSKLSSCSCKSSNLGVVDLSPLAMTDGSPRFQKISSGIQEYSWNPCKSFSQGDCTHVAVCQKSTFPNTRFYNLGTQASAQFKADNEGLKIIYTADSWGNAHSNPWDRSGANTSDKAQRNVTVTFTRTSFVKLVCDLNNDPGVLTAEGEDKNWPGRYYFTLTSYHACPSYLKPSSESSSLSAGSLFLIMGFTIIIVYLVIGSIIQIFMFKRTGMDAIPNKTFWMALPGLVKDGTVFVLKRGRNSGYSEV